MRSFVVQWYCMGLSEPTVIFSPNVNFLPTILHVLSGKAEPGISKEGQVVKWCVLNDTKALPVVTFNAPDPDVSGSTRDAHSGV